MCKPSRAMLDWKLTRGRMVGERTNGHYKQKWLLTMSALMASSGAARSLTSSSSQEEKYVMFGKW